jgi:hypothetical protein
MQYEYSAQGRQTVRRTLTSTRSHREEKDMRQCIYNISFDIAFLVNVARVISGRQAYSLTHEHGNTD